MKKKGKGGLQRHANCRFWRDNDIIHRWINEPQIEGIKLNNPSVLSTVSGCDVGDGGQAAQSL